MSTESDETDDFKPHTFTWMDILAYFQKHGKAPDGYAVIGNKIYAQCADCEKIIRINGFFGGVHLCLE